MKVKSETIARTVCLIIALLNQGLAIYGKEKLPITENEIYQVVSFIATTATTLWAWWKNNSFTPAAIKADEFKQKLKEGQK